MNKISFEYTTKKGLVTETFDFSNNKQTIKSTVKTTHYPHDNAQILSYYITELLRELTKRNISYVQFTTTRQGSGLKLNTISVG